MIDSHRHELENHVLNNLPEACHKQLLYVAFSGGLDSKVLLHILVRLSRAGLVGEVRAIHVNHGLQHLADNWQNQCERDCKDYQIQLITTRLNLGIECHSNVEEKAREGRYHFFESIIQPEQWLLVAQHMNDQAETLLFRLLRGCGLHGAAAMRWSRPLGKGKLFRPLLNITREQLEDYANHCQLVWIEDPTNAVIDISRNYLRHRIMPELKHKWPGYLVAFFRFTQIANEQGLLLEDIAREDLLSCTEKKAVIDFAADAQRISITKINQLSLARKKNLLHYWGRTNGKQSPSAKEIDQLIRQLSINPDHAINVRFSGASVRSFQSQLILTNWSEPEAMTGELNWADINQPLPLENGVIIITQLAKSGGIRLPEKNEVVVVRKRAGGERCQPDYRDNSTELKKIYQELMLPVWHRKWLPVIYYGNKIAAVPGVFISKEFIAKKGQPAYHFSLLFSE